VAPHSLGNSINWKHARKRKDYRGSHCDSPLAGELNKLETRSLLTFRSLRIAPHSLGNSINWKLIHESIKRVCAPPPHSLGNSINWKQALVKFELGIGISPHSLGNSINWKLPLRGSRLSLYTYSPLAGELNKLETVRTSKT